MWNRSNQIKLLIIGVILCCILVTILSGCAPVDPVENASVSSIQSYEYSYRIYMNGEIVEEGQIDWFMKSEGFVYIKDISGQDFYTGWNNVIITKN